MRTSMLAGLALIVIGVLGGNPFGTYLDEVVRGEMLSGRSIQVRRLDGIEDAETCHILFIAESDAGSLERIFAALKHKPVLTVGDSESFSKSGGMFRFATRQARIRLQINLKSVQAAELKVSSKLLRLADIVAPGKG
jgi:hypothetical protein